MSQTNIRRQCVDYFDEHPSLDFIGYVQKFESFGLSYDMAVLLVEGLCDVRRKGG